MARTTHASDSLLCSLGLHAVTDLPRWNDGFYFARCNRCGQDLVRTAYSGWRVPQGHRVIWQKDAPERAVTPGMEPDEPAAPVGALLERHVATLSGTRSVDGPRVTPAIDPAGAASATPTPVAPPPAAPIRYVDAAGALDLPPSRIARAADMEAAPGDTAPVSGAAPAAAAPTADVSFTPTDAEAPAPIDAEPTDAEAPAETAPSQPAAVDASDAPAATDMPITQEAHAAADAVETAPPSDTSGESDDAGVPATDAALADGIADAAETEIGEDDDASAADMADATAVDGADVTAPPAADGDPISREDAEPAQPLAESDARSAEDAATADPVDREPAPAAGPVGDEAEAAPVAADEAGATEPMSPAENAESAADAHGSAGDTGGTPAEATVPPAETMADEPEPLADRESGSTPPDADTDGVEAAQAGDAIANTAEDDADIERNEDGTPKRRSLVPDFMDNPWPISDIAALAAPSPRPTLTADLDMLPEVSAEPPAPSPQPTETPRATAPAPAAAAPKPSVEAPAAASPPSPAAEKAVSLEGLGLGSLGRLFNGTEREAAESARADRPRDTAPPRTTYIVSGGRDARMSDTVRQGAVIGIAMVLSAGVTWAVATRGGDDGVRSTAPPVASIDPAAVEPDPLPQAGEPPAAVGGTTTAFVAARRLNCRAQPTRSADSLTVLDRDRRVQVTSVRNDWSGLAVRGGTTCWVQTRFLADSPQGA